MSGVYYNEWDGYCAQWLRNLIAAGHLPEGEVDERDIKRVGPDDLRGFSQCHFFAGIGGWPLALRLARWPDAQSIWTGSCPCQPFSCAGKRTGESDERHLWPEFHRLISARRPATVAGEQVASKDGREWFAGVRVDLEALGYGVGAADLCAAGAGAPHIRQRLWWLAESSEQRRQQISRGTSAHENADGRERWDRSTPNGHNLAAGNGEVSLGRMAITNGLERKGQWGSKIRRREAEVGTDESGLSVRLVQSSREQVGPARLAWEPRRSATGRMDHTAEPRRPEEGKYDGRSSSLSARPSEHGGTGFWSSFDLIPCLDGKARRIEPGTFPLAHGVPARVGKLRAYGNAIVPQVAASFIVAYMECRP